MISFEMKLVLSRWVGVWTFWIFVSYILYQLLFDWCWRSVKLKTLCRSHHFIRQNICSLHTHTIIIRNKLIRFNPSFCCFSLWMNCRLNVHDPVPVNEPSDNLSTIQPWIKHSKTLLNLINWNSYFHAHFEIYSQFTVDNVTVVSFLSSFSI